jgi:aromatic amino acid aminotransferase I
VDRFVYGSGAFELRSLGARLKPIPSDKDGIIVEELERILTTWDSRTQGKKPHILYLVPVGNVSSLAIAPRRLVTDQRNPSGVILPSERYDAIYTLCQQHDLLM